MCPSRDPRPAAYHGDDLGAPPNELTPPDPGKHICWEGGEVKLSRECDIFIDQRLTAAPEIEKAPLIFGLHLRVAFAERSLGGGGPSFDHVMKALARSDSTVVWPPRDRPGYRYLRHEPIAKPIVFLAPETEHGNALEHKLQTSERMVLVDATAPHDNDARSLPRTSRILLVPAVACAFAARHDVFDGAVEHTVIRVLETVESGKQVCGKDIPPKVRWSTVPVTMPRQGLRDAVIEGDGTMVPYQIGVKPPARFRVRRVGEKTEIRKSPYYPDPAAALVVLRLAHPETGAWLEEPPLVLRLREPIESKCPTGWPDVLPMRIDLIAAEKSAPSRLGDGGWSEASGGAAAHHPGTAAPRVAMRVVTVTLAPGEAVKLRAWFVPEAADLAAWFDAVEQAAALAHAEGKARGAEDAKAADEGLVALLGDCVCANDRAVDATAEAFHTHMLTTPLPEIADTLELDCIYATDAPAIEPAFISGTVGLARPLKLEAAELTRFIGESGRAGEWQKSVAAADDATALVPGGVVAFDPATTSQLVIEVEMTAPGRETLDVEPQALPPQLAPLASTPLPFRVDEDGVALFGHQKEPLPHSTHDAAAAIGPRWVELMQVNNIPFPTDARAERRQLCLEEVVAGVSTNYAGASVVFHSALEQTQARRVRLRVRALPRHAPLITGKKTEKEKKTSIDKSAKLGSASSFLWAPATARPAPVVTEDFEPAFEWPALVRRQNGRGITIEGERRAVLRLRLRRPWFTSGEDEGLAVVLWPPAAFALTDNETASFLPEDPFLQTLHEDDLGPLGRFVSVWGFDPMGAGPPDAPTDATPPKRRLSAFLNRTQIQLDGDMRFHPHLLLPVPGQIALESLDTQRETMAAVAALSVPVRFRDEPSFPRRHGEAYVDLSLRLPYQTDVLFRLGLARLQENARPACALLRSKESVPEYGYRPPLRSKVTCRRHDVSP